VSASAGLLGERAVHWLSLFGRLGLAGLMLYAGALKLADLDSLAQDISHYRLVPDSLGPGLALAVPVFELVVGLGLLTRTYMQGAAALSGLMLIVFAGAMAQAKLRGIDLTCGCFGASTESPVSWAKVALNLGLAILALWIARRPTQPIAPPRPAPEPS